MHSAAALLTGLAALVAGCAAPAGAHEPLDTGLISPGGEATLTFAREGRVDLHCDPHPMMEHRVVVAAGGSLAAHVHIRDADEGGKARFDPPEIHVAPGATVTYHNHGNVAHTASEKTDAMEHGGSASAPYGI